MEEEEKSFTDRLHEKVEQYAKTTIELYKLKATNTLAGVFAAVATGLVLWILFLLILLFLSIGLAFYLGHLLGEYHHGFFIVGGFYILIMVVIYIYRVKCFTESLTNFVIKQIYKEKDKNN
ncbi:MAG TPA: hypothetical protein VGB50_04525 [Flavobacterium sp.]|jgi:fatty acid desaturase